MPPADTTSPFADLPRSDRIRRIPFDPQSPEIIAAEIGGAAQLARFRLPSGAVWQITVPNDEGRPATMLTLWPTIRRIDAIGPGVTVVFTDVVAIDLVPGVEAQFRRGSHEVMIVARGGKVIVRA